MTHDAIERAKHVETFRSTGCQKMFCGGRRNKAFCGGRLKEAFCGGRRLEMPCSRRSGVTLMNVIAAIAISATVAVATLMALHEPTNTTQDRACQLLREAVSLEVQRYRADFERYPRANFSDLIRDGYWTGSRPCCPAFEQPGQGDLRRVRFLTHRGGDVRCPVHGELSSEASIP